MKPSFLILAPSTLTVFWSNTRPAYFSLGGNLAQTIAAEIALEDPTDNNSLLRIDDQLTVRAAVVSAASALGHLGCATRKPFCKPSRMDLLFSMFISICPFHKIKATVTKMAVPTMAY